MSKRVLLLLLAALTAACLRLGSAEGDPIPPSLVDLLKNSPISSVEDLKQLLQQETDSIEEEEEEEEEHDILVNHTHGRYTRSLVEAQPAQQAVCKVRTEVMEVTRAMLDRRNANFLLWPPCVEVQRCSGCCNTRLLQCVPTVTSTRYLQVIKIQYINKNAHYEKAIIPVEDHAGCRCQAASATPRSSVTANANPNPNPPPPQPQQPPSPPSSPHLPLPRTHHPAPPKSHASKADLHRHDDLKRNQQGYRHEEREWQPGRYTQLAHTQPQPQPHWTQPRTHHPASTHALHTLTHGQPSLWSSGVRADQAANGGTQQPPREGGHGSGYDGSKEDSGARLVPGSAEQRHLEHTQRQQQLQYHQQQQQQQQQYEQQKQQQQHYEQQRQQQQQQYQQQYQYRQHYSQQAYPQYNRGGPPVGDQELRTQYRLNGPQSDSASPPGEPTRVPNHKPQQSTTSPEPTNQRELSAGVLTDVDSQKDTVVKNQTRTETKVANHESGKEREETGSANSGDTATELINQKKDKDSETSGAERPLTELERRQKLLEIVQREPENLPHLHPHHPQHRPKPETTTHKSVVTTTADPSRSSTRVLPFRPALPRRRRKHRSRISKAAIRAMIM